jgi:hypothetical protein
MKKVSILLIIFMGMFVWAGAQAPDLSKLHPKPAKKPAAPASKPKSDPVKEAASTIEYAQDFIFLRNAVQNAFFVVKQSYNVRKDGSNVAGNDFFGHIYSILPIVEYGYVADVTFQEPWRKDRRYDEYAKCEDCLVSVDVIRWHPLSEKTFKEFKLSTEPSDSLASGVYLVRENAFGQKGLKILSGNGVRSGYMVWFVKDAKDNVDFNIQPMTMTMNENAIFSVKQPANQQDVIGGAFISLDMDEPGAIRMDLIATARLDPYGSGNWELVKFQRQPVAPPAQKSGPRRLNADLDD